MNLHAKVMNIQLAPWVQEFPEPQRSSFKNGHQTARHEAAELALTYDNLLDVLENDLKQLQKYEKYIPKVAGDVGEMLEMIRKVRTGEYK